LGGEFRNIRVKTLDVYLFRHSLHINGESFTGIQCNLLDNRAPEIREMLFSARYSWILAETRGVNQTCAFWQKSTFILLI
jgi:hypothetical protein